MHFNEFYLKDNITVITDMLMGICMIERLNVQMAILWM